MNEIRAQMDGTTVVRKLNQGFSRLYEVERVLSGGVFSCLPAGRLGTYLDKQKGTKRKRRR